MNCFHCGREIAVLERIGFRAACPACAYPAHVCRNCDLYDPGYNNQCRETQAERVVDKDRANFCEYFAPRRIQPQPNASRGDPRGKLDALFRKKP